MPEKGQRACYPRCGGVQPNEERINASQAETHSKRGQKHGGVNAAACAARLAEIGRATVRWAALDLLLVRIASVALKNVPASQSIIFGESNAGQARFRAFERVIGASFFDEGERSEILARMKEVARHYQARNALTHEPLEGFYTVQGKSLKFHLQFIARDGKKRAAVLKNIESHVRAVDQHLESLESILEHLLERYEQAGQE